MYSWSVKPPQNGPNKRAKMSLSCPFMGLWDESVNALSLCAAGFSVTSEIADAAQQQEEGAQVELPGNAA